MLERRALFFPLAELLEDPREGTVPAPDLSTIEPSELTARQGLRSRVAISSWHANSDESFAMWKLYASSPEALAIRTTVGRLKEALRVEKNLAVHIGQVQYIDHRQDHLGNRDPLTPFFRKFLPFAYENEVRALAIPGERDRVEAEREKGVCIHLDLKTLVEAVYVSPHAQRWFFELTGKMVGKFGCDFAIRQSSLTGNLETRRSGVGPGRGENRPNELQ